MIAVHVFFVLLRKHISLRHRYLQLMTAGDVMGGPSPASGGTIQFLPVSESDNSTLLQSGEFLDSTLVVASFIVSGITIQFISVLVGSFTHSVYIQVMKKMTSPSSCNVLSVSLTKLLLFLAIHSSVQCMYNLVYATTQLD